MKMSVSQRGKKLSEITRKKLSEIFKGKYKGYCHTAESRMRMSAAHKGKPLSEKHRKKLKEAHSSGEVRKKISLALKGNRNPNFGKPRSDEIKKKISESLKGRISPMLGRHHTLETKRKISEAQKGKKGNMFGKKQPEEVRNKIKQARLRQRFPVIDSSLERKVEEQLRTYGIIYEHPWILGSRYQCDFYIPSLNLIIECDGSYWHSRPKSQVRDKEKDTFARDCGFKMLRLSEPVIRSLDFNIRTYLKEYGD